MQSIEVSPMHIIGIILFFISSFAFSAIVSSVSPHSARRSLWPIMQYVHPTCAKSCADTCPVCAPFSKAEQSCVPYFNDVFLSSSCALGKAIKEGHSTRECLSLNAASSLLFVMQ